VSLTRKTLEIFVLVAINCGVVTGLKKVLRSDVFNLNYMKILGVGLI
jgi:hypothetical protein